jgi:hypothetical protein
LVNAIKDFSRPNGIRNASNFLGAFAPPPSGANIGRKKYENKYCPVGATPIRDGIKGQHKSVMHSR